MFENCIHNPYLDEHPYCIATKLPKANSKPGNPEGTRKSLSCLNWDLGEELLRTSLKAHQARLNGTIIPKGLNFPS